MAELAPPREIPVRLPGVPLIRAHYKLAGLFDWKNERVARLCDQIRCTPYELCAAAGCFESGLVKKWVRANKWPVYMTIPFSQLEQQINRFKFRFERRDGPSAADIIFAKIIEANLVANERSQDN